MFDKVVIALLLFITAVSSFAGELEERAEHRQRFSALFMQEKFDQLDRIADEFRTTGSRSSSGLWKLTLFYAGAASVEKQEPDEKYWSDIESKALKWVRLHPESPAPYNVYAGFLIHHGWAYRGEGLASQVNEENWKPFYEKIREAKSYLLKNKQVAGKDPRWYELMLIIARAEGWERSRFDQLVAEAVSKHPYFYQIYFAALDYLVPKWSGSKEDVEAFANFAVEKTKEKESMGMYARVYWYASQTYYSQDLLESDLDWKKMKRGIDDVLSRYPDQWNINNFAFFACISGDKRKTRELLGRIVAPPIDHAWGNVAFHYYDRCKAWTESSARLIYTDAELRVWLVGSWREMSTSGGQGEATQQNLLLNGDGTIRAQGVRYTSKLPLPSSFRWSGRWGVEDGLLWYVATDSDQPQVVPVGRRIEDTIKSVSNDEWVMIRHGTGEKSRAIRLQ